MLALTRTRPHQYDQWERIKDMLPGREDHVAYTDAGQQYYEDRYRERVVKSLTKRAHTLGFQLVPSSAAAAPA